MQIEASIEGEKTRERILDYMAGKKVTNSELQDALNIPKSKMDYFLKTLFNSRHIYRERLNGCIYLYGRTSAKYIPKDYTKQLEKNIIKEEDEELDKEDMVELKPTVPHARVVRLLKNPLAPAPKRKYMNGYGSMQSGLGLFNMEAGL